MGAEVVECHSCHEPVRQMGVPWRRGDPSHDDHAEDCRHKVCSPYGPHECCVDSEGRLILQKADPTLRRIVLALVAAKEAARS